MTWVLVRKLLRDIRVAWIVVAVLLFLFQILWARITMRVTIEIFPALVKANVTPDLIMQLLMRQNEEGQSQEMLGQMVQAIIGGERIDLTQSNDLMTVGYVHPLMLTVLGIWALGRAANAIAGEIDRGTMELLLAQPIRRAQVVLAHLLVDAIVLPSLCFCMWIGTYCGTWWMGLQDNENVLQRVDPTRFLPGLLFVVAMMFAISGVTMWISAMGRSRARVWGWAVTIFLSMFLINILGQIFWPEVFEWVRPFTVYFHYHPQMMILDDGWRNNTDGWLHLAALIGTGAGGYGLAWGTFCYRDLPAPL